LKALVTAEMDKSLMNQLESIIDVTIEGWGKELRVLNEDELISYMKDNEILITSYDQITKKVIENCKNLKLIVCTRANPVNIDVIAATEKNIPVIYTPGRNSDCTSEFTMAMILNAARKIPMAYKALKDGKYLADSKIVNETKDGLKEDVTWALGSDSPYVTFKGSQLKGKILGILGLGSIGKRVATYARAFGMYIYVYDPYIPEIEINDNVQTKVSLEKLLKESDFITCHCKVTKETTGLIGQKEFEIMKDTAYFINSSRGAIVNESALIDALRNHKIAGAALDVYESEPLYKDHPFINELDNIVITPHLAGATNDAISNHTAMIIEEIKRYLNGDGLLFQYNHTK